MSARTQPRLSVRHWQGLPNMDQEYCVHGDFLFMVCLTTLSTAERRIVGWTVNNVMEMMAEGRGSGVAGDIVVTFVFKDWPTPGEASGRTAGLQAEIWTKDF